MSTVNELFQQIQALPEQDKQELLQLLATKPRPKPPEEPEEPFVYDPNNPSIGLLYDEPELADEIVRLAMEDRERRNGGGQHE